MKRVSLLFASVAVIACAVAGGVRLLAEDCPGGYTGGLTALTDLGSGKYLSFRGGLYPGGSNVRPAAHEASGITIAENDIYARNAAGAGDPKSGKIVMISIGMCSTNTEFESFLKQAEADPAVNPSLVFVNTAQGSQTVDEWGDPAMPEHALIWKTVQDRVVAAGATAAQVQVAWFKHTTVGAKILPFPTGAAEVQNWMKMTLQIAKAKYPNLRLAYFSSRIYAGYALTNLNPEPKAFENGFSVKWLIEQQISGCECLRYSGSGAKSPWLAWGPYLWANGLGPDVVPGGAPGRSDGLEWVCDDFAEFDRTHPSAQGAEKVGKMLLDWLKTDSTSKPWFLALHDSSK
ncbi:MAG: hypothetical protein FD180_1648 [Planctomycetota bacterium]|nr:MAG: hypothetical protein FD180_1648 [Planctomycetota bacterium]